MSPLTAPLLAACLGGPVSAPAEARAPQPAAEFDQPAWYLAVSPDGKRLACFTRNIDLWDLGARRPIPRLKGLSESFINGQFLADGRLFVRFRRIGRESEDGQGGNSVMLYDLATQTRAVLGHAHNASTGTLALSPDGRWAATGGKDDCVIWDLVGDKKLRTIRFEDEIVELSFNRSGALMAVGLRGGQVKVLGTGGWEVHYERKFPSLLWQCRFMEEDRLGVSYGSPFTGKKGVLLCDAVKDLGRADVTVGWGGSRFARCPKTPLIAVASAGEDSKGRDLMLWSLEKKQQVVRWCAHGTGVEDVQFAPDGSLLYSSGKDGKVRAWEVAKLLQAPAEDER
jgi:WD40 repeat protein